MEPINVDNSGIVTYTGTLRAMLEKSEGVAKDGRKWIRRKYLMHRKVHGRIHFFMFDAFDDSVGELQPKSEGTIYCNVFAMRDAKNGKLFHVVNAIKWVPKENSYSETEVS